MNMKKEELNQNSVNVLFSQLNEKADLVYKFASLYNDYMAEKHDYGTGQLINMVEVHTLTAIEENPGITISQLASMWRRTNSALSQTATKLEKRGFITRVKDPNNARSVQLFATPEGVKLSLAHKAYDVIDVTSTLQTLVQRCGAEEVDHFFKVIDCYINLLEEE